MGRSRNANTAVEDDIVVDRESGARLTVVYHDEDTLELDREDGGDVAELAHRGSGFHVSGDTGYLVPTKTKARTLRIAE